MWWRNERCREVMAAFADVVQSGYPDHRFESNVERHRAGDVWLLTFAFLYVDCELNPGSIAVHVITQEMFERAEALARHRRGGTARDAAMELYGIIEAEEGAERVEASGV